MRHEIGVEKSSLGASNLSIQSVGGILRPHFHRMNEEIQIHKWNFHGNSVGTYQISLRDLGAHSDMRGKNKDKSKESAAVLALKQQKQQYWELAPALKDLFEWEDEF